MAIASAVPSVPDPSAWLGGYAKVQRVADAEIRVILRQAVRDINKMLRELEARGGIGAMARREQLLTLKREMFRRQAEMFRATGDVIRARRYDACVRSVKLTGLTDNALFRAAGLQTEGRMVTARALAALDSEGAIDAAMMRMSGASRAPLSERIYRARVWADGVLDRRINSALARGLSSDEFAREAISWFSPNVPGGARYAAMRLARTEINNAYHAQTIQNARGKPWVKGMQWELSGSHPKPDRCDELAEYDGFQLGAGVYLVDWTPSKPHPQCLCTIFPVNQSESSFLDSLVAGNFDSYLGLASRH